jgi:hypothetical protein
MRHVPKWITTAMLPIAAGALAVAVAVPAMAQQPSGKHQPPTLTATSGKPNLAGVTMETPTPVNIAPTIVGQPGTTGTADGPTLIPTSGKPDPASITMETPEPLSIPPTVVGTSGTTGPAPS